jgi:preprotein translocase subunit SecG
VSQPDEEVVRARQRRAARVTAVLLFAFIALTFFITIAKLTVNR